MLGVLAFLLGAAVGSFLNVVVDRLPRGQPIQVSRSRCDACGTALAPRGGVVVLLGGDYIAAWYIRLAGGFAL
ncbi:MAG: prepilin peptidase [Dehalococcoidia bacterium]|nr:prepilin peptidase [Dehalococcoidia bacterium]